jgi:hypothetical protein
VLGREVEVRQQCLPIVDPRIGVSRNDEHSLLAPGAPDTAIQCLAGLWLRVAEDVCVEEIRQAQRDQWRAEHDSACVTNA